MRTPKHDPRGGCDQDFQSGVALLGKSHPCPLPLSILKEAQELRLGDFGGPYVCECQPSVNVISTASAVHRNGFAYVWYLLVRSHLTLTELNVKLGPGHVNVN